MTNTSNLPVGGIEMEYPLMVEQYALHREQLRCRKIQRRPGHRQSHTRTCESEDTMLVAASTERAKRRPWGLSGGGEGGNASMKVIRNGRLFPMLPNRETSGARPMISSSFGLPAAATFGPAAERETEKSDPICREGIIDRKWIEEDGMDPGKLLRRCKLWLKKEPNYVSMGMAILTLLI